MLKAASSAPEKLLFQDQAAQATEIYDEVRKSKLPQQRIIEATRGAILARGQDGIPLLLELFQASEKPMFQLGLTVAREFPGKQVDVALAAEIKKAKPRQAAQILQAMADRSTTVVVSAILSAAKQGPQPVRAAALVALGKVGRRILPC